VILISLAVQLLILTDVKNIAYSELKFDVGLFPAHDLPEALCDARENCEDGWRLVKPASTRFRHAPRLPF
jgi:hypothetical protein